MLAPQAVISDAELTRGIRDLLWDAAFATVVGALASGVVLITFALHLGASNAEIGVLAAIPLLTQMLQVPAVWLVEHWQARRRISVLALFTARLALPIYALVPYIGDRDTAVAVLTAAALLHYGMNAVGGCSWNSWIRDLIPPRRLGEFFGRRGAYATAASAGGVIVAGLALEAAGGSQALGDLVFSALFAGAFVSSLISTYKLAQVPEPFMDGGGSRTPLSALLRRPLRDRNFRNMLRFMASWQFAVNLATPFFTVYFVRELGFSLGFVMLLTFVSQLANLAVVRGWGRLSDRFANKSVLSVAVPLFLLCIAGMVFADEFGTQVARAAYLLLLHAVMGCAAAGVGLASGNIAIKLSPEREATSYMATNALISAIAAGIAPIIGGWAADFFAQRSLSFMLQWQAPGVTQVAGLAVAHWEFFFVLAALLGLYTLHRLSLISEAGEVERSEVVQHMWLSARRAMRGASPVAGLRLALTFPSGALIEERQRRRRQREAAELISGWA